MTFLFDFGDGSAPQEVEGTYDMLYYNMAVATHRYRAGVKCIVFMWHGLRLTVMKKA